MIESSTTEVPVLAVCVVFLRGEALVVCTYVVFACPVLLLLLITITITKLTTIDKWCVTCSNSPVIIVIVIVIVVLSAVVVIVIVVVLSY